MYQRVACHRTISLHARRKVKRSPSPNDHAVFSEPRSLASVSCTTLIHSHGSRDSHTIPKKAGRLAVACIYHARAYRPFSSIPVASPALSTQIVNFSKRFPIASQVMLVRKVWNVVVDDIHVSGEWSRACQPKRPRHSGVNFSSQW